MSLSELLLGKWQGEYAYDEEVDLPGPVEFEFEVHTSENGDFRGTIKDDESTGGMKDTALAVGKIQGNQISFYKEYPRTRLRFPEGELSIERSYQVHYKGSLDAEKQILSGTWKIFADEFSADGYVFTTEEVNGWWFARKVS